MEAAGGLVDLRIELSARMKRRHDDFEGRLLREFRVRIDRDAAAVIGHREPAAFLQLHLDEGGVAGHRLVHGIVDHLREEVMIAPSRRCRRYTCRAGGEPVRGLPAPRCRTRRSRSRSGIALESARETFAVAAFADPLRRADAAPSPKRSSSLFVIGTLVRGDSRLVEEALIPHRHTGTNRKREGFPVETCGRSAVRPSRAPAPWFF